MYGDTCKIGVVSCSLLCLQQKFLIVVELERIYPHIYIYSRQTKVIVHPKYIYSLCHLSTKYREWELKYPSIELAKNLQNFF